MIVGKSISPLAESSSNQSLHYFYRGEIALRLVVIACVLCSIGCGGGGDSSGNNAVASNDSAEVDEASYTDESMMNEHGMDESGSSGEAMTDEVMAEDEGMIDEHGADEGYTGDEAEMMAQMEGEYSSEGNPSNRPRKPPRPEKIEDWTPEHVAEAIRETDVKVIPAIKLYADQTKNQVRGVEQLKTWLTALNEKPEATNTGQGSGEYSEMSAYDETTMEDYAGSSGGYNQPRGPSNKEQITAVLLNAFAINATKPAYETLATILSGQLTVGEDKNKAMELAFVTLMKNVSDPNNPAKDQLLKAITSVELDSAPPAKPKEKKTEEEKEKLSADSLNRKVKELHLGFAIAAMNGLIGARGEPPKGNQHGFNGSGNDGYDGYETMEMANEPGSNPNGAPQNSNGQNGPPAAKPIHVAPIDLEPEEAPAALSYLWSEEMVAYAVEQLQKYPKSTEAFVFAASMPVPTTREAVRNLMNEHRLEPPKHWLHESVFASQLSDPAIHLLIKEFPREVRPSGNQGGEGYDAPRLGRPGVNRKKDDNPEAIRRQEASYSWMDVSEKTLVSLMQRMYEGSLRPDAQPHDPANIPLSLHAGAEVTASMQFVLPNPDQSSEALDKTQKTIVNYVRIESDTMNQKTVLHYRNSMRDKTVVPILNNNGMWLDGPVKPNRKNGTLRSVDVLLSKGNVRPSIKPMDKNPQTQNRDEYAAEAEYAGSGSYGGGGAGGTGVVEILTVEIPPPVSEEEEEKVTSTK